MNDMTPWQVIRTALQEQGVGRICGRDLPTNGEIANAILSALDAAGLLLPKRPVETWPGAKPEAGQ